MDISFNSAHCDDDLRSRIYHGEVTVLAPSAASLALVEHTRGQIEPAFAPRDPRQAHEELDVSKTVEILVGLKPQFIHHPDTRTHLQRLLIDAGCDPYQTYQDVPRLRVAYPADYLTTGIAYAHHPHRDTWFSAPLCQLNWWMPIYDFAADQGMAFHPRYWGASIKNGSADFNYYQWNADGRKNAAMHVKSDTRVQPHALEPLELEPSVRLVVPAGGIIVFSGAQLHSTVRNETARARWSIDFRTVNIDDLANGRGPVASDSASTGTSLRDFRRVADFAPMPEEIVARYDDASVSKGVAVFMPGTARAEDVQSGPDRIPKATKAAGSTTRITIGMPVFNGADYISQALDSILAQTFGDFELIISDNASDDGTQEICQEYVRRDRRIRYLRQPNNVGAAANHNLLVAQGDSPYFKWAAHDDVLAPRFLEQAVDALDSRPDVVLASPASALIDELGQLLPFSPERGGMVDRSGVCWPLLPEKNDGLTDRDAAVRFQAVMLKMVMCVEIFGVMRRSALMQTSLQGRFGGADKVLLAQMALLGPFWLGSEVLFYRRCHAKQFSSIASGAYRAMWFSGQKDTVLKQQLMLLAAYCDSANKYHLGLRERLSCYRSIAHRALSRGHQLRRLTTGLVAIGPTAQREDVRGASAIN